MQASVEHRVGINDGEAMRAVRENAHVEVFAGEHCGDGIVKQAFVGHNGPRRLDDLGA